MIDLTTGWYFRHEGAILGPVSEVECFYCANGFSGPGFQHSPTTGRVIAG